MTGKIFRAIMTAVGGVLLASLLIILGCLYDYFGSAQTKQLWQELDLAAAGVETAGDEYLRALDGENRLTWIATDGSVLYDVQADEHGMENHADREEVRDALQTGKGQSRRYSHTLSRTTIYCAKRLSDGSVLRISLSRATMGVLAVGMIQPVFLVLIVALILSFFLARGLSRRIVEPLNDLDLEHPLANRTYDEIAPLLRRIAQQRNQIDFQLRKLQRKKDEFAQIIEDMKEGLVLLDNRGVILSINPAAERIFRAEVLSEGQDFLTIERSREIRDAMSTAANCGHSEIVLERNGKTYQVDFSRIESEGMAVGVVLLAFDITDKVDTERMRREFTANVSHELKTPLTAILGSSELLQTGMVKQEDVPRFVKHIHDEAERLLLLIEDIIRLSRLDEGAELPKERVNLTKIAEEEIGQLREKAERYHVTLELRAESCMVEGVPQLFHEIVYNLAENAIKYNVPGGNVCVIVENGVLTVADTGIGIPAEHRERVFERFYRVDKSHSRSGGGTGLGLSIVKHAAAYLGAEIDLTSAEGKGTTIHVTFPKRGA